MIKFRRLIALVALVSIFQVLLAAGAVTPVAAEGPRIPPAPFLDVYGTKYQDAVGLLYLIKVASGTGANTFSPYDKVTRAQMAVFLLRALGQEADATAASGFPDVPAKHWASGAIARAVELGLLKGDTTGRFRPEDPVTFAEVATMLIRALGYDSSVPPGEWPVNYVLEAKNLGLLAGSDFSVGDPASRGEVAILLANAIFKVKLAGSGQTLNATIFKAAASIKILPEANVLTGDRLQLSLQGTDWFGTDFPVTGQWSVPSGNATVDSTGLLQITGPGTVQVQAAYGDLNASTRYVRVQSISISPATTAAPVGATVQFTASGVTTDGQTVPVDVTWTATGPGTIDPRTGVLTVNGPGTITVSTTPSAGTSATVTAVDKLTVSPASSMASSGQKVQFTATGMSGSGTPVAVPVQWSVLSGGGSIDAQGLYTAGPAGHVVIQAQAGTVTATASLDVVSAMRIEPQAPALTIGTTTQFTAEVQTASGWQAVPATWTLSNNSIGVMSTSGKLAATGSGTATITAQYGGLTTSTTVTVAGPAVALRLTAERTMLPANGSSTTTITATFVDAAGLPTNAPTSQVLFSLSTPDLGTLDQYSASVVNNQAVVTFKSGTVSTSGTISATAPGTVLQPGTLSLFTVAPTPASIRLSAYPATIAADGVSKTTITAQLLDQDGQPFVNNTASSITVSLSASGTAGTLLGTTVFILPGQSSGTTLFQAASAPGTSTITGVSQFTTQPATVSTVVVGAPAKLAIHGPLQDTIADGSHQMTVSVEVQDDKGNVVTGDSSDSVSLTVLGPAPIAPSIMTVSGGVATFQIATVKAGTYTFVATSASKGLLSARATGNFVAGPATAVTLSLDPPVPEVTADGATPVRLMAQIVDAHGNLVTSATTPVTFIQNSSNVFKSFGSITATTVGGVATVSITPKTIAGTDTFMATAPGLQDSNTLAVSTRIMGGAYKVVVQTPTVAAVTAGQDLTVYVWVEDAQGHVLTNDFNRPISLVLSDPTAKTNSPQIATNGVAKFTVTPSHSGTLTIQAQSGSLLGDTTGVAISVLPAPADHIELTASATSLSADGMSSITITPKLVDIFGNQAVQQVLVTLSVSDSSIGRLASTQVATGASVSFIPTTKPGTVTITGSSTYPVTPLTLTSYIAGPPTRIVVDPPQSVPAGATGDAAMKITVRVTDDAGHTVTSVNTGSPYNNQGIASAVFLTVQAAGSTTTITPTISALLPYGSLVPNGTTTGAAYIVNGQATFTLQDTAAETVTLTPTFAIGNLFLTPVSGKGSFTAGTAAMVKVTATPSAVSADAATSVSLTAYLADVYGNPVDSSGDTFTFSLSSTQLMSVPNTLTATASASGATIVLQNKPGQTGVTYVTATSLKTGMTSTPVPVVQDFLPSKPAPPYVTSYTGSSLIYAADPAVRISISFSARMLTQTVLVYVNGVQVPLYQMPNGGTLANTVNPGSISLTGYILRSDYGGPGTKTVVVVLQDSVGTGMASDPVTFVVH